MSLLKIHIVKIRGIFCIKYQEKLALFNKLIWIWCMVSRLVKITLTLDEIVLPHTGIFNL